jgi:hypothetical protein
VLGGFLGHFVGIEIHRATMRHRPWQARYD